MFFIVGLILFLILIFVSPTIRCALSHPILCVRNGVIDLIAYFKQKKYNNYGTGELVAYTGLFGRGKTLSAVHRVVSAYKRYDGKPVWCPRRKKFVTQKIQILSNVALNVPYIDFTGLDQIVFISKTKEGYDDEHDTLTITLVLGDEFSVQMNSRNFKSNIDPLFLNTILTCRHYYISLYYTAQRFCHVDALLRQVTSYVVDCNKLWRFQRLTSYDAWEMENATSGSLLKPLARSCWFVTNADYNAYNTLACVGNLEHSCATGDMLSEKEILESRQTVINANMDGVSHPSKRYLRRSKK